MKGSTDIKISKPTGLEVYRTEFRICPSITPKIYVGDSEDKIPHILTGPYYVSDVLFSYLLDWWPPSLSSESLPNTIHFRSPDTSGACQLMYLNLLNAELNPICYLLALLGAHNILHVCRIRVKSLILRLLMSYTYGAPILDVSRSHTTHHSR